MNNCFLPVVQNLISSISCKAKFSYSYFNNSFEKYRIFVHNIKRFLTVDLIMISRSREVYVLNFKVFSEFKCKKLINHF